jgi:hypothetical protein
MERLVRADKVSGDATPRLVRRIEAGLLVVSPAALILTTKDAAVFVENPECRIGSLQPDVDRSVLVVGHLARRLVRERRKERLGRSGRRRIQPGLRDEQESETEREGEAMGDTRHQSSFLGPKDPA